MFENAKALNSSFEEDERYGSVKQYKDIDVDIEIIMYN